MSLMFSTAQESPMEYLVHTVLIQTLKSCKKATSVKCNYSVQILPFKAERHGFRNNYPVLQWV